MSDREVFRRGAARRLFARQNRIGFAAILSAMVLIGTGARAEGSGALAEQGCDHPQVVDAAHCVQAAPQTLAQSLRPQARLAALPVARWDHRPGSAGWTRSALAALQGHAAPLVSMVPRDIAYWCPAYAGNGPADRRAFWNGFLSALAKHESTYRETAVGGGGKWHGLLQILPGTARGYGCAARSGRALRKGEANVACGLRIMTVTVRRDGVIHGRRPWRGVSADWGPMRSAKKRADMAGWLGRQDYCRIGQSLRPRQRPAPAALLPE